MNKQRRSALINDVSMIARRIEVLPVHPPLIRRVLFYSAFWPCLCFSEYVLAALYYILSRKDNRLVLPLLAGAHFLSLVLSLTLLTVVVIVLFVMLFRIVTIFLAIDETIRKQSIALQLLKRNVLIMSSLTASANAVFAYIGFMAGHVVFYLSPLLIFISALSVVMGSVFPFVRLGLARPLVMILLRTDYFLRHRANKSV